MLEQTVGKWALLCGFLNNTHYSSYYALKVHEAILKQHKLRAYFGTNLYYNHKFALLVVIMLEQTAL